MNTGIKQILESLERGDITSEEVLLKLKAVNRLLVAAAGRSSGRNIALAEQLVVLGIAEDVHAEAANDLALRGAFSVDVLGH